MPIHNQSYSHWDGTLKSHRFRWWVITREGLRIVLRRKLFVLFVLAPSIIQFLVYGAIIYGVNIYGHLFNVDIVNPKFFFGFFTRQSFFIVLICVFGGSGLIANDMKNNALQLYFSKPLTRADYLVGKFAIVLLLMSLITLIPGILLFVENVLLSGNMTFLREKYWLLGSITLYSLLLMIPAAFLILALSSATRNSRYAAVGFAAVLVGTPILGETLRGMFDLKKAVYISYSANLEILGRPLFGLPNNHSWLWSMCILLCIIGACLYVMSRKVREVSVVK